jgi:hypothetical protein
VSTKTEEDWLAPRFEKQIVTAGSSVEQFCGFDWVIRHEDYYLDEKLYYERTSLLAFTLNIGDQVIPYKHY